MAASVAVLLPAESVVVGGGAADAVIATVTPEVDLTAAPAEAQAAEEAQAAQAVAGAAEGEVGGAAAAVPLTEVGLAAVVRKTCELVGAGF